MATLLIALALAGALSACTLTRREDPPPVRVTATLRPAPTATDTLPVPPTDTPVPTVTATGAPTDPPLPTATAPPVTPSITPPPTFTPLPTPTTPPPPTRTSSRPPTVLPLDDGSGQALAGTGLAPGAAASAPGLEALPATLYYLSDVGAVAQVWRVRAGLPYADQVTLAPQGVTAFDVAPSSALAYVQPGGQLVIDGVPFLPPAAPDGTLPRVTALAWSPDGGQLAYTLYTPGADAAAGGEHAVDGLWLRGRDGSSARLAANVYTVDDTRRILAGPLRWRPDGGALLAGVNTVDSFALARIDAASGALTPVWDADILPPDAYTEATWTPDGAAAILSGADRVLRVTLDPLAVETLVGPDAGLVTAGARLLPDGSLVFVGSPVNPAPGGPPTGPRRLYRIPRDRQAPEYITEPLTAQGAVEFLWDAASGASLIAVYEQATLPLLGTGWLREADGTLHELGPVTGLVGAPHWGPLFRPQDRAQVSTALGDALNLRDGPNGSLLARLENGTRLTITGESLAADGYRWWPVMTADEQSGWVVEAVPEAGGGWRRTLLPVE